MSQMPCIINCGTTDVVFHLFAIDWNEEFFLACECVFELETWEKDQRWSLIGCLPVMKELVFLVGGVHGGRVFFWLVVSPIWF